ncbi:hypothetical protein CPB85DRAFT_1431280 [Mucidula mucida]|nr:hypothetical protein CPB85DRAFT_1431280 [Mucidula mucida]
MMFKFTNLIFAAVAAAFLLAFQASAAPAVADNDVDACNGSNHYGVGHSCAFAQSQGTCQNNSCGVLICVPN